MPPHWLATALIRPWNSGSAASPIQPVRSAASMSRCPRGGRASSSRTGSSLPASRASAASALTQRDETESTDHSTMTVDALDNSASSTSCHRSPVGMLRSQKTVQPKPSSVRASRSADSVSSRAYDTKMSATTSPRSPYVSFKQRTRVRTCRGGWLSSPCRRLLPRADVRLSAKGESPPSNGQWVATVLMANLPPPTWPSTRATCTLPCVTIRRRLASARNLTQI